MGEYDKYFIYDTPLNHDHPQSRFNDPSIPWSDSLYIVDEVDGRVPGAFYLETCMIRRTGTTPRLTEPHTHPFPEYLLFLGTNPDDEFDLGGEVELWLGGEKHLITRTCAVFAPAEMPHCPLVVRRVDRPFMFITTGPSLGYNYPDKAAGA
jgi:hypothetical protein